jgi:uncharacterized HhH-GPD family protein
MADANRTKKLNFTESDEANSLLATDDLAVLLGMLYDQQFPMERAFFGPQLLKERLGADLDAELLAGYDTGELESIFKGPPAIHRYPSSMAKRTQDLCRVIVDEYDGEASQIWLGAENGTDLLKRLKALPGFGDGKSRVFIGLLGKRLGVAPRGWEDAAADWPSIADVAEFEDVLDLREAKRQMKAAKKQEKH